MQMDAGVHRHNESAYHLKPFLSHRDEAGHLNHP
jgi:hypothetical protein